MDILKRKINKTSHPEPPGIARAETGGDYASKHALFFHRAAETRRANRVCNGRRGAPACDAHVFPGDARATRLFGYVVRPPVNALGRLVSAARVNKGKHDYTDIHASRRRQRRFVLRYRPMKSYGRLSFS